jgi:hypothetical protein
VRPPRTRRELKTRSGYKSAVVEPSGEISVLLIREEFAAEGQLDAIAFGSGWRSIDMSKSMVLMMPSPNSS